jgi:hypothetical protein
MDVNNESENNSSLDVEKSRELAVSAMSLNNKKELLAL